jgi:hypothetical protein
VNRPRELSGHHCVRLVSPYWQRGRGPPMNGIIYLVGLVVVVMLILSFLGLR